MSISARIEQALQHADTLRIDTHAALLQGRACLDLTTLESTDTAAIVRTLAQRARDAQVAALCIFPTHYREAAAVLQDSSVRTATVAMAFPHGQAPLASRLLEVELAVQQGFDEIDVVIPRHLVLDGLWQTLADELQQTRAVCGERALKVILETGELQRSDLIYRSAMLALEAGADFVKTSTGKTAIGATPEAAAALSLAVKDHGESKGVKISGGVRSVDDFLRYYRIARAISGETALRPAQWRVGASSLLNALDAALTSSEAERL